LGRVPYELLSLLQAIRRRRRALQPLLGTRRANGRGPERTETDGDGPAPFAVECDLDANTRHGEVARPLLETAQELFNSCVANGGAKWDHSALVKALERMANHEVAK